MVSSRNRKISLISNVLFAFTCIWTLCSILSCIVTPNEGGSDISKSGYWIGVAAAQQHIFDSKLSTALVKVLKEVQASTVLELGAGMGLYSAKFMSEGLHVSCYDGNPNTQELSHGRCGVLDLSQPIQLGQFDWVLSLEVGEHIPRQFEDTFINNLDRCTRHGIIVSWAVEGQGGHSHVNCRNNSYITKAFEMRGYSQDLKTQRFLRHGSTYAWFKHTIMVFTRKQS